MTNSEPIDYQALAKQMLDQWQAENTSYFRNPAFLKSMMEMMQAFQNSDAQAMSQENMKSAMDMMQQNMQNFTTTTPSAQNPVSQGGADGNEPAAHPSPDSTMDADELAWVKQRLAACEARIAMLEAKVD